MELLGRRASIALYFFLIVAFLSDGVRASMSAMVAFLFGNYTTQSIYSYASEIMFLTTFFWKTYFLDIGEPMIRIFKPVHRTLPPLFL
jgi:hypothetical protein